MPSANMNGPQCPFPKSLKQENQAAVEEDAKDLAAITQYFWPENEEEIEQENKENQAPVQPCESVLNASALKTTEHLEQENLAPVEEVTEDVAPCPTESRKRPNSENAPAPKAKRTGNAQLTVYQSDEPDEELEYGPNGHLEFAENEILGGGYKVLYLLGAGSYAAVYMAENIYTKQTVALKIAMCGERDNKNSEKEIRFSMLVSDSPHCVNLLDEFTVDAQHGKHHVLVFEMLGPTLYQIINRSNQKHLTTDRVRKFCRDILRGLDYSHNECGIIHCDLKPCNIMITIDQEEAREVYWSIDLRDPACTASLKIGDFGISTFKTEDVTRPVQTCAFRAPEAYLRSQITPAIDMWSVGCVAYQMATQRHLFPCHHDGHSGEMRDHLSKISAELGPIHTQYYLETPLNTKIFDHVFGNAAGIEYPRSETPKISVDNIVEKSLMSRVEAEQFCDFLKQLLMLDPKKRLTAKQALLHPFLLENNNNGTDFLV